MAVKNDAPLHIMEKEAAIRMNSCCLWTTFTVIVLSYFLIETAKKEKYIFWANVVSRVCVCVFLHTYDEWPCRREEQRSNAPSNKGYSHLWK